MTNTPSPSSRVPSAFATSFREPPPSARSWIAVRDGGNRCWLCHLEASAVLEVAHNSFNAQSDTQRFLQYQEVAFNLLSETTHPAHYSNLILPCKNHHALHDCHYPAWVLLPDDLEFFLKWEMDDWMRREAAAAQGAVLARTTLGSQDVSQRCFVPAPILHTGSNLPWHGIIL
jgi:hypothetical protein